MSAPVVWHWEALASAPLPAGLTVTAAVVLAGTPLSPNVAFVLAAPTSPVLAALAGCGPGGCQNATLVTLTGTGFGQAAPRDEPLGGWGGLQLLPLVHVPFRIAAFAVACNRSKSY